ncbi:MAG TPA: hypothetical protein PLP33_23780 [Leptospiraceae bacterium]|jgi:hypothetical protein|nr:hypothetical protein [Leptospiraceae bacterium]
MPNLTRSDIQSLINQYINDPNDSLWTAAQKQAKIQEAQEQFVEDTQALTDTQSFSVVAGTNAYALSTDTLDILRVGLNGVKLRRYAKFDLDILTRGNWAVTTGTPVSYYVDYTSTNKNLVLYPIPTANDAGSSNLVVEYVKVPPTLSSDSSTPLNSQTLLQPYLMALAYYAASEFLSADNDPQKWIKADRYKKMYKDKVSDCREIFVALSDTVPMRMRGGRFFRGL